MYEEIPRRDEETMEFEEFKFDDISSIGHGQLEQHREIRQYARVAAYEMPRLFGRALLRYQKKLRLNRVSLEFTCRSGKAI